MSTVNIVSDGVLFGLINITGITFALLTLMISGLVFGIALSGTFNGNPKYQSRVQISLMIAVQLILWNTTGNPYCILAVVLGIVAETSIILIQEVFMKK